MRQLFLPACVFLLTWSGATEPDAARWSLDAFTGKHGSHSASAKHGSHAANAARPGTRDEEPSVTVTIPRQPDIAVQRDGAPAEATLAALDLAVEFPVPSGVVVNNGIPIGIPLPPIAKPVIARSTEEICDTLTKSAQINDLPAPFFIRLLFQESRFNPAVISTAGAQGIAQFMPETATDMGLVNPFDPAQAIPASARLLNSLLRQFGNLGLAAAAYNAGPKRVIDWLSSKGKGKLPEETQGYVKIITGKPVENWSSADARHPGQKLPRHAPCQESAGLLAWNGPAEVPVPQPSPLRAAAAKPVEKPAEKAVDKLAGTAIAKRAAAHRKPKPQQIAQR